MAIPDRSIDPRLLASAQEEFMKHGYLKADLKTICDIKLRKGDENNV